MEDSRNRHINATFKWSDLGDIELGRPNLGFKTDIRIYRLMQYTLKDVLVNKFGIETTNEIIEEAGYIAGIQFARNVLNVKLPFDEFIAEVQRILKEMNVGILRIEKADLEKMEFYITVAEDLDCSGMPVSDETLCNYDEGFLSGIMKEYTGKEFKVKEIDCWATGDRVCRFQVKRSE